MSETRPALAETYVQPSAGRKALIRGLNPGTATTTRKATLPCLQGDGNDRTSDQSRVDEGPLPLLRSDRWHVARHGPNPPSSPPESLETRPQGTRCKKHLQKCIRAGPWAKHHATITPETPQTGARRWPKVALSDERNHSPTDPYTA